MKTIDYAKCGKYYSYMFWLLIPRIIAAFLTNQNIGGRVPALFITGTVITIVQEIAYAFFIWQLQSENESYRKAAIVCLAMAVWDVLQRVFRIESSIGLSIAFSIVGLILTAIFVKTLYEAHAYILEEPSKELSEKWLKLEHYYMIAIGLIGGSLVLFFIPFLTLLAAAAGGIMVIVVSIMELVYTYRSANSCKDYAAYLESK